MRVSPILDNLVPLAGVFIALILVAGSRDAQVITGVFVVAAALLNVPAARSWVRRVRRGTETNLLNVVEQRARAAQAKRREGTPPEFDHLDNRF